MKAYISRDEDSDDIWVWLQPRKGNWKPETLYPEFINFQRQSMTEIDRYGCYTASDFKKKFGMSIHQKTIKHVHLPDKLLVDGKLVKCGFYFG